MRFKLALLTALPLALCAADKPSFSSTGYFTPECLASFRKRNSGRRPKLSGKRTGGKAGTAPPALPVESGRFSPQCRRGETAGNPRFADRVHRRPARGRHGGIPALRLERS